MQNLTAGEENLTDCVFCLESPIYIPAILPYTLIFLPANGWVLWLMISSPVFWTDRMDVSEFHLVLTELLFGFMEILIVITSSDVKLALTKLISVIFSVKIQFQSNVCVERYFAVVHPVLYLRYKPLRYRMSFCCIVWLETIPLGLVEMLMCSVSPVPVGINVTLFVSVFIVSSFCCLSILRALKQPSPGEGEREGSNLIKKRAFNIVLIFVVILFFGYLPLITMVPLAGKIEKEILCIAQPLAYCVTIWFGAFHPIHYILRTKKLQVRNCLCLNCFQV